MSLYRQIESIINRLPIDEPHAVATLAFHFATSGLSVNAAIAKALDTIGGDDVPIQ